MADALTRQREAVKGAIVHEKQEAGSMLCAQHCLNNLLQGQYFDAAGLADIAKQLDDIERSHLDLDDAQWADREVQSRNADETGFFSVGVIETALQVWGVSLIRWGSQQMRQLQSRPEDQLAFVLNLDSHWFCFRSFGMAGDVWFNLNSFLSEPTWVGSGYLGALLDQATREGYSVFVVRTSDESSAHILNQFRSSPADQASNAALEAIGQDEIRDEDEDLRAAIQASLAGGDAQASSSKTILSTPHRIVESSSPAASSSLTTAPTRPSEGKRRRSRRQGEEDLNEVLQATRRRASGGDTRQAGSSRDAPISIGDDNDQDDGNTASAQAAQSRSPFLNPTIRQHLIEGDEDGVESLPALTTPAAPGPPASRAPNAPRRDAHGGRDQPIEIGDDDYEDEDDFDDSTMEARERYEERLHRRFAEAAQAFAQVQDRDYDDEDAELQRALAASMADTSQPSRKEESGDSWLAGEDAEEQARILAQIAARSSRDEGSLDRHYRSPTPADVGRIAKMREEARRKEREEREREERHQRGEVTPEPEATADQTQSKDADEDEDEDEEGDESQQPLSAEELRRMRLARFGS